MSQNDIYVPAEGPSNAKLALVGEAPGADEERQGRPFVGPSGQLVDSLLSQVGAPRETVYLTNVVKYRPPGNDIKALHLIGRSIEDSVPQLQLELESLKPNCVIAIGGTALTALTGLKGIEKYRGSILQSSLVHSKVVPTIHPAAILHGEGEGGMKSWKDLTYIKWDFERAKKQSESSEYDPPRRNLFIARNALDLDRFIRKYEGHQFVSVDIETFRTLPICIGLAFSADEAISVPLFFSEMSRSDRIFCWQELSNLLANPSIFKIGQNFKFDQRLLRQCVNDTVNFGFKVNSFFFDTMLAFRILYPELPSSLQFSTSVLTEEPYYKDEGHEYNPKRDKFDRLLLYNAKDAAVTYEVFEKELEELQERNLEEFFFTRQMPLHPLYSNVELRGIKRDSFQKRVLEEKYKEQQEELEDELFSLTSDYLETPINVNSNGRNGDVPKLLFGLMKLPARKATDEMTLDAMMRNAVKDPRKKRVLELILEVRKVRKTIGTYINHEVDSRGRTLTGVRICLETGRTSNGILKVPVTTVPMGLAFQTITKHGEVGTDLRSMFVPDENHVFMEPDLSSAEARVVAILASDARLLKIFDYGLDIHRITAGWMEGSCPDDLLLEFFSVTDRNRILDLTKEIAAFLKSRISNDQRQIGKKFRHAGHYAMGKREAARQTGLSEWKTNQILEKFHATNPNIRNVFHKGIREALHENNRVLVSPHGRARLFLNKWGDELWKEAYADIPQATVSDQTKFAMRRIERRAPWIQLLSESHDSFLAQIPLACGEMYPFKHLDEAARITKEELEKPIDFKNCSLSRGELRIPCEIKIGKTNWMDMEAYE